MAYTNIAGLPVLAGSGDIVTKAAQNANGATGWVNMGDAKEIVAQLSSDAGTGTSPTLDVKFQTSYDGTDATAIDAPAGAFTQVTTVASAQIKTITGTHRFIKVSWAITGTTPSFNFGVYITTRR